jgi:glycosyltransferase involved in cell wall biosynthesis
MLVSILVAAGEGAPATLRCLAAIARTVDEEVDFEVVLVDDATTDATAQMLAGIEGDFRVLRNEVPRGVRACWAQAAAVAGGDYIVLLRHDATVRPDWLAPLLGALAGEAIGPLAVRARTVTRAGAGGEPACLALRARTLRARSDAARAEAIERACEGAVEQPGAVVELDAPAPDPGTPAPMLRDVGGLGSFLATRLAGRHGDVLFCSSAARALRRPGARHRGGPRHRGAARRRGRSDRRDRRTAPSASRAHRGRG